MEYSLSVDQISDSSLSFSLVDTTDRIYVQSAMSRCVRGGWIITTRDDDSISEMSMKYDTNRWKVLTAGRGGPFWMDFFYSAEYKNIYVWNGDYKKGVDIAVTDMIFFDKTLLNCLYISMTEMSGDVISQLEQTFDDLVRLKLLSELSIDVLFDGIQNFSDDKPSDQFLELVDNYQRDISMLRANNPSSSIIGVGNNKVKTINGDQLTRMLSILSSETFI